MHKLSIVIPVYDEAEEISNCINSLAKQTYKDFEIIIVDDGCTDDTIVLAKNTAENNNLNLKVLKQDHGGPGLGRNLGSKEAQGDILIFIDADMTFTDNYIENLTKPILKHDDVLGTTHDYEIAVNTDNIYSALWGKIRVSKEDAPNVKIFRAIRKDKFLELGGFDPKYSYADDQTLWFKYELTPTVAKDTTCYHKNPETLRGTYKQARWIGASWKERFFIFQKPIMSHLVSLLCFLFLPFMIIGKVFLDMKKGKMDIINRTKFYSYKFTGYLVGIFRALFLQRFAK